jgi:hypothetical protein
LSSWKTAVEPVTPMPFPFELAGIRAALCLYLVPLNTLQYSSRFIIDTVQWLYFLLLASAPTKMVRYKKVRREFPQVAPADVLQRTAAPTAILLSSEQLPLCEEP